MISYMRDNFERFNNYLFIDVMRSSVCDAKELCYIVPVVLNEIRKITVVYDAYTFILEFLFQM